MAMCATGLGGSRLRVSVSALVFDQSGLITCCCCCRFCCCSPSSSSSSNSSSRSGRAATEPQQQQQQQQLLLLLMGAPGGPSTPKGYLLDQEQSRQQQQQQLQQQQQQQQQEEGMRPAPHGRRGEEGGPSRGPRGVIGSGRDSAPQQRRPGLPPPPGGPPAAAAAAAAAAASAAAPASAADPVCLRLHAVRDPRAVRGGPAETAVLPNGHGRPILCIDVHPTRGLCATGSADGGLRVFRLPKEREGGGALGVGLACELYGSNWGHRDWVSCCAFAQNGCLLSGGLDGKLCLWPDLARHRRAGALTHQQQQQHEKQQQQEEEEVVCRASTNTVRCDELSPGHRAGVSQVAVRGGLGVSSGYDGSLRLWDMEKKHQTAELPAVSLAARGALGPPSLSPSPLMQFVWLNAFAAAGSKNGGVVLWDLNRGHIVSSITAAHRGAVGDLKLLLPPQTSSSSSSSSSSSNFEPLLVSGGRGDGRLCVFDLRCLPTPACTVQASPAAINVVLPLGLSGGAHHGAPQTPTLCTLSADGSCKAWDLRGCSSGGPPQGGGPAAAAAAAGAAAGRGLSCRAAAGLLHAASAQGGKALLCGACLDEREGLVCAGAADGAVYLFDMKGDTSETDGRRHLQRHRNPCWGFGCDSKGAVQALTLVSPLPRSRNEGLLGGPQGGTPASGGGPLLSSAVLAGGDDGQLTWLHF
ncbi:hypothetical protein ACSSS7_005097 [Eimeria intestinalis]